MPGTTKRYIDKAVDKVNLLSKENKDWPYGFCVGRVSKDWNLEYSYLMSECGKRRRKSGLRRKKFKSPQEAYGSKDPYWLRT